MSPGWLELSIMERVEESVLGPVAAAETAEVVTKEKKACWRGERALSQTLPLS
jgi:hypothetical protein